MEDEINSIEVQEFVCRFKELIKEKNAKFCFFLGAGCSVSSGIQTAGNLVHNKWIPRLQNFKARNKENFDDWFKKRFPEYDERDAAKFYGEIIEKTFLTPMERQREIERLVAKKDPGFGYAVLAQLMTEEYGERCNTILTTNFDDMVADALYLYTNKKPIVIAHESLAGFVKISDTRPLVIKLHGDSRLSPHNTRRETSELDVKVKKVIKNLLSETGLIFLGYGGNDKSIINILNEVSEEENSFQWGIYWVGQNIPTNEMGEFLKSREAIWVTHKDFDELMLLIKEEFGLKHPSKKRFGKLFETYFRTFQKLNSKIHAKPDSAEEKIFLKKAYEEASKEFESWWAFVKDHDKAEELYKIALEIEPENTVILSNYATYLKDIRKDYDKAEELYKKAIEIDTEDVSIIGKYANFLDVIRKDYGKAEELYRKAIEIDPENFINFGNYATFLKDIRKDYDKAEELYKIAIEIEPDTVILRNYAIYLKDIRKDYDKAEELYKAAIEIDPENSINLGNYSGLLLARSNREKGFEILKKAISITDKKSLLLECWFYCYAHTVNEKFRIQSLNEIKKLIKSGVRSPSWNLEDNVKTALKSGHPEPEFLKKLSRVISDEAEATELSSYDFW